MCRGPVFSRAGGQGGRSCSWVFGSFLRTCCTASPAWKLAPCWGPKRGPSLTLLYVCLSLSFIGSRFPAWSSEVNPSKVVCASLLSSLGAVHLHIKSFPDLQFCPFGRGLSKQIFGISFWTPPICLTAHKILTLDTLSSPHLIHPNLLFHHPERCPRRLWAIFSPSFPFLWSPILFSVRKRLWVASTLHFSLCLHLICRQVPSLTLGSSFPSAASAYQMRPHSRFSHHWSF